MPKTMHPLPAPHKARPCLLVIDDDDTVPAALAVRLGPDFEVLGLADPGRAVERARALRPDVILCDIDMPGLGGDEVAFALSEDADTAAIPLIYLTGLVSPKDAPDLEGVFGEHPTVSKGASTEHLRAVVSQALGPAAAAD